MYYGVHFNRFLLSQLQGLEVGVEWWTEKMDGTLVPTVGQIPTCILSFEKRCIEAIYA